MGVWNIPHHSICGKAIALIATKCYDMNAMVYNNVQGETLVNSLLVGAYRKNDELEYENGGSTSEQKIGRANN